MLAVAFIELCGMNVFMALGATRRRRSKVNAFEVWSTVSSPMAFSTGDRFVGPF